MSARGEQLPGAVSVASRFTDLVGCRLPIRLAAMGGVGTTELAAAVIAVEGLGW